MTFHTKFAVAEAGLESGTLFCGAVFLPSRLSECDQETASWVEYSLFSFVLYVRSKLNSRLNKSILCLYNCHLKNFLCWKSFDSQNVTKIMLGLSRKPICLPLPFALPLSQHRHQLQYVTSNRSMGCFRFPNISTKYLSYPIWSMPLHSHNASLVPSGWWKSLAASSMFLTVRLAVCCIVTWQNILQCEFDGFLMNKLEL